MVVFALGTGRGLCTQGLYTQLKNIVQKPFGRHSPLEKIRLRFEELVFPFMGFAHKVFDLVYNACVYKMIDDRDFSALDVHLHKIDVPTMLLGYMDDKLRQVNAVDCF